MDDGRTLFIVNPHAAGGTAQQAWAYIEPTVRDLLPNYAMMMTQRPDDVGLCLQQAMQGGINQVISVGGDGTNNTIVNAIMRHNQRHPQHTFMFGALPAGTGRDWARGIGLPLDTRTAVIALLQSEPQWVDVGLVSYQETQRYFLNISSAGISNDVTRRVESTAKRRPWTFLRAIVTSLARYRPQRIQVELDGVLWYEGAVYIATVANGRSFGQGLLVAPAAAIDDGLFDVVLVEEMRLDQLVRAFPTIYKGTHIHNPKVKVKRARHVKVISPQATRIPIDLDGEPASGDDVIEFSVQAAALQMRLGHR